MNISRRTRSGLMKPPRSSSPRRERGARMNVVLKKSRREIGTWVQAISIDGGIPLPQQFGAPGYRYGTVLRWQPLGPPPQPQGDRVEVPFWCDRNDKGEIEMVINDDH